jgi:hypothetical protein
MKAFIFPLLVSFTPFFSAAQDQTKPCANFAVHGFANREEVIKFWNDVRTTAAKSDLDSLQKMMRFPLEVRNTPSQATMIKDLEAFKKERNNLLNKNFLKSLSEIKSENAFCNANGSGTPKGELWAQKIKSASGTKSEIQITVLNAFVAK